RQAKPRAKGFLVDISQPSETASAFSIAEEQHGSRASARGRIRQLQVERGEIVPMLIPRDEHVIPQPIIHSQFPCGFPVVLYITGSILVTIPGEIAENLQLTVIYAPEQKACNRVACICTARQRCLEGIELEPSHRAPWVDGIRLHPTIIQAELQ